MPDIYRVGRTVKTNIYRNEEPRPCITVSNGGYDEDIDIAFTICKFLNAPFTNSTAQEKA